MLQKTPSKYSPALLLLLLIFCVFTNCSKKIPPTENFTNLINAIKSESRDILLVYNEDSVEFKTQLEEALDNGNNIVNDYLEKVTIGDSLGDKDRLQKELNNLEKNNTSKKDKELIKLLWCLSVNQPGHSYNHFTKILSTLTSNPGIIKLAESSLSYYYFKLFLYESCIKQFPEEKRYLKNVAVTHYNRVVQLSKRPFTTLSNEKLLLDESEKLSRKAAGDITGQSFEKLITSVYDLRAFEMETVLAKTYSDSLFDFIEKLRLKAVLLYPNGRKVNFNLGALYNNQITYSSKPHSYEIDNCFGTDTTEQRKIKEWVEKSAYYIQKSKECSSE